MYWGLDPAIHQYELCEISTTAVPKAINKTAAAPIQIVRLSFFESLALLALDGRRVLFSHHELRISLCRADFGFVHRSDYFPKPRN